MRGLGLQRSVVGREEKDCRSEHEGEDERGGELCTNEMHRVRFLGQQQGDVNGGKV